jgi:hypothetical protein
VTKETAEALRDHFLGWQCRVRQIAMRQQGGRPSPGMQPRVLTAAGHVRSPALTVLIVPKEPLEATTFFRFQVQKTHDPRDIYERGLAFLQGDYFQRPKAFSDRLTAVLAGDSGLAAALVRDVACVLEFHEFRQRYRLRCAVVALSPGDPVREASVWHNRIFNPSLPDAAQVLAFQPDWESAEGYPPP